MLSVGTTTASTTDVDEYVDGAGIDVEEEVVVAYVEAWAVAELFSKKDEESTDESKVDDNEGGGAGGRGPSSSSIQSALGGGTGAGSDCRISESWGIGGGGSALLESIPSATAFKSPSVAGGGEGKLP